MMEDPLGGPARGWWSPYSDLLLRAAWEQPRASDRGTPYNCEASASATRANAFEDGNHCTAQQEAGASRAVAVGGRLAGQHRGLQAHCKAGDMKSGWCQFPQRLERSVDPRSC